MKTQQKTRPIRLRNVWNNQEVICDDIRNVKIIDGQEFVEVHFENQTRKFWLNRAPLKKVKEI